jgi:type I restriction enzyme S subunit
MSNSMSFGKAYILKIDGCVHDGWLTFRFNNDLLFSELLLYFLNGSYDKFKEKAVGTGVKNLNTTRVKETLVPLPPLYEQKRIVEKIDGLFKLIDNLDTDKKKLLETIELTRNKVLQDAIQGKLVEQDPNDEPASELLKKIEAEKKKLYKDGKIRKPKKLPPIKDEEKPFDIPENWEWVRLGEIFLIIRNGANIKQNKSKQEGYPITRIETISNADFDRNKMGYGNIKNISKYEKYVLKEGDILMSHINSVKHLGKTAYYEKLNEEEIIIHGMNLLCLRSDNKSLNYRYSDYYFKSSVFYESIQDIIKKAVNQASINITNLSNKTIPLPPINEQKRIVEKIDSIFDSFEVLEKYLDN